MYKKVLVPLDGSALAESVLPHAVALAKGCNIPEVWLLQAEEPLPVTEGMTESMLKVHEQRRSESLRYLERTSQRLTKDGVSVKYEVQEGEAGETIVRFAEKNGVDLIIMATHGRSGVSRWVFGSVADKVLRAARVPVLLVRAAARS